jgi:small-conductance mechanosensitive channel
LEHIGTRTATAVAIVVAAFILAQLLKRGFERLRRLTSVGAPMLYVVEKLGGYLILLVGLLAGISALGVNLESFAVFAGAIGVGVGLGLQTIVKEFVSGLVLIFDPTIQVGDFVEVDDDVRGEVVEIGSRATRLRTNDELHVVIPNSTMMQSRVTNWTYNENTRRIHVPFSVEETADTTRVRDVVMAAAKALPFTLQDDDIRKTQVWLTSFDAAGLCFELVVWPSLESSRHPKAMHAAYTWAIHEALKNAGIANASPQVDLRVLSLFGHQGDNALNALNALRLEPTHAHKTETSSAPSAPNDAAGAVFDDADRRRRSEADEPRKRDRKPS